MDAKTFKIAYISLAFLAMLGAIAAALLHQQYAAIGLIVLASAIILAGAILVSHMYKLEKSKGLKKS